MLDGHGPLGRNLAELGVDTNDRATLDRQHPRGREDPRHGALPFGASAGIGGTVTVPVHLDVVVTEPTLWIGETQVLDGGLSSEAPGPDRRLASTAIGYRCVEQLARGAMYSTPPPDGRL